MKEVFTKKNWYYKNQSHGKFMMKLDERDCSNNFWVLFKISFCFLLPHPLQSPLQSGREESGRIF